MAGTSSCRAFVQTAAVSACLRPFFSGSSTSIFLWGNLLPHSMQTGGPVSPDTRWAGER